MCAEWKNKDLTSVPANGAGTGRELQEHFEASQRGWHHRAPGARPVTRVSVGELRAPVSVKAREEFLFGGSFAFTGTGIGTSPATLSTASGVNSKFIWRLKST